MGLLDILNLTKKKPEKSDVRQIITIEQQLQRVRQNAQKYDLAVQAAESPMYPNRFLLMQLYQQIVLDGQVQSGMMQRKSKILSQRYIIKNSAGEEVEQTKLFEKKWFLDFMNQALDSIFWGYSLTQFGSVVNDEFTSAELVPRIYVIPERNLVRSNTATVTEGIVFTDLPYSNWCVGVGDKTNLGLLMYLAPYVIWKKNAMGAWSEFAEIFGAPIRIGKTNVRDETTRSNMVKMMKEMAVASWAVLDLDDSVELQQASRSDAFNVYDKMVERCNSEISKIILGQTGTTDEKSYSGSANVHENVAQMVAKQDLMMIEQVVNGQLIPMMIRLGFPLNGLEFAFDRTEQLGVADKAKIDASFMPYYKYSKEYLEETYNVEIEEAIEEKVDVVNIAERLKNLYNV